MRPATPRPVARPFASVAALVLAAVVLTAGCSSGSPSRSGFTDALVTSGISRDEARCATDAIFDHLSDAEIDLIIERGPSAVPPDEAGDPNEPFDKVHQALNACRTKAEATSTTTSSTTTVPSGGTGGSSTTAPATSTAPPATVSTTAASLEPAP